MMLRLRAPISLVVALPVMLLISWVASVHGQYGESQEKPTPPGELTVDQKQQLKEARTPDACIDQGKQFALTREIDAAHACIDKAVQLEPALLIDDKPQQPAGWHQLWFSRRAELRERQLKRDDIDGRLQIAVWLYQAGVRNDARQRVRQILKIHEDHAEARRLAEAWNLFGGGPFRFDLSYGLRSPLLLDSISDEGETVEPRGDKQFLLVPFAYQPGELKMRLSQGTLKVQDDAGKSCRLLGFVLLNVEGAGYGPGGGVQPGPVRLQMQQANEPIWEQLQIEAGKDGQTELLCINRTRPRSKRDQQRQLTPSRAERRDSSSADRRRGPRNRNEPEAARDPNDPQQDRPASGYAAYVVEVPAGLTRITAVYNNEITLELSADVLRMLEPAAEQPTPEQQAALVENLSAGTQASNPLIASTAVGKLALLREGIQTPGQPPNANLPPNSPEARAYQTAVRLDAAVLGALLHPSDQVRQQAFDAFVFSKTAAGPEALQTLLDDAEGKLALSALTQAGRLLANLPPADENAPGGGYITGQTQPDPALDALLVDLRSSNAPPNLYAVLGACVQHPSPEVVRQAVQIILDDGSKQSLATLAAASAPGRQVVAERFAGLPAGLTKEALFKLMLLRPDPASLKAMLDGAGELVLHLRTDEDPVMRMLASGLPADLQAPMIALLARADLNAVAGGASFRTWLESVRRAAEEDAAVRAALMTFVTGQLPAWYEAPIPSDDNIQPGADAGPEPEPAEAMLAEIAATPGDNATALKAATTLVQRGRVRALLAALKSAPPDVQQAVIAGLAANAELAGSQALPMLLGGMLGSGDEKTLLAAINGLGGLYKSTPDDQRWLLDMAVKLGVDVAQLGRLAIAPNDKLALPARSLLRQLGKLDKAEAAKLDAVADPAEREQQLANLQQQRAGVPVGKYRGILCLDFQDSADPGQPAQPGALPARPPRRVPMPVGEITVQASRRGGFMVMLDKRDLQVIETPGAPAQPTPGVLRVDALPALSAALESAVELKHPLARRVDRPGLVGPMVCELRHRQLGTWMGQVRLSPAGGANPRPGELRIAGATLVLELVTPGKAAAPAQPAETPGGES